MKPFISLMGCALGTAVFLTASAPGPVAPPRITFNDNHEPAGRIRDGVLSLDLEITEGDWHLLGADQPAAHVYAFAVRGQAPSIPGPLIRVPVGTEIQLTIANTLDTAIVVHGFGERRQDALESARIAAGATREARFVADVAGTFFYWGGTVGQLVSRRPFETSQLAGGLIVDDPAAPTRDNIMMIGTWYGGLDADGVPDVNREFLVINGRPWPLTERLTYDMGDSVRWRLINVSTGPHVMHLHGFFYRVDARGDIARDTIYWPDERRTVVSERIVSGSTVNLVWSPDRPGGWIFHCHMSSHVMPNPPMTMEAGGEDRFVAAVREGHAHQNADHHVVDGMGGLLMAMYIRPPPGWEPREPKRREMRLFIQSAPASGGLSGRQFGYVLQEGEHEPARDSVRIPGSPLILRKGEPTAITVLNRTREPSQVHWHGLEIESYFDGTAGVGGYPDRLTPAIAPGDSFEIRITPPRAGTFMYHTHVNDLRQQGSGLYGAFIVLDEGQTDLPETDHLFVFGESPFRSDGIPILNGTDTPAPITAKVGTTLRLRFMDIVLDRPNTMLRLLEDGFPETWTPVAKDGFDLPAIQRRPRRAEQRIAVGETYDFEWTPGRPGEARLELRTGNGGRLVEQLIRVVP